MPEEKIEGFKAGGAACQVFDLQLPDYLEGEAHPSVFAHAQECPFCRAILADLELLRSASLEMPLEDPPARLWKNIRAGLAAEGILRSPATGWQRWFESLVPIPSRLPLGAMACLVILGAVLLAPPRAPYRILSGNVHPATGETLVASTAFSGENSDVPRTVQELEKVYRARETVFEPAVKATYEKSLASLDTSIRETLDSVQQDPDNTLAKDFLLDAYTRKAEVLTCALEFDAR